MTKEEIISKLYDNYNEASDKLKYLESHADFEYWTVDKAIYRERAQCLKWCMEMLVNMDK